MEWLFIFGLGFWVWLQAQRIDALTKQLARLEQRAAPATVREEVKQAPQEPVAANAEDVLLLDTPLPAASNDDGAAAPPAPAAVVPIAPLQTPPRPRAHRRRLDRWLAENALAWLGAATIAVGAALLVGFAAQSGFFTPARRIVTALVLGIALLGASAWLQRAGAKAGAARGHPLLAALLAGAAAATFYGSAWAAHGLYGFIDWPVAAACLLACAVLLVVLAQTHGQALGALAIGASLLAPALSTPESWPTHGLTLYLCAVAAAGAALAGFKRWAWTAAALVVGLYGWFAASVAMNELTRALAIALAASLAGATAAIRAPTADPHPARLTWTHANRMLPAATVCVSSVLMLWTWGGAATDLQASVAGPALAGLLHIALAAWLVRLRAAAAVAFAVAGAAFVIGFGLFQSARIADAPNLIWPFIAAASLGAASFAARPHRHGRILVAATGAIGAALLSLLAAFQPEPFASPAVWAPLFAAAALALAAAGLAARSALHATEDWAVDVWVGASAALALIAMESLAPTIIRPAAHAALAFAFAGLSLWRGWRGASAAALTAAAFALAHAIAPDFAGAAMSGDMPLGRVLLCLGAGAAFLFGAADVSGRRIGAKAASETLGAASLLMVMLGLFLILRWAAAGGMGAPIDPLSEAALQALMLLAAGFLVLPRTQSAGLIAHIRAHGLLAVGLTTALLGPGLMLHPWWGQSPQAVAATPVLNAQMLAFAAPAAFALATARELYGQNIGAARSYAIAGGVLGLIWALSEVRRGFNPADMAFADVGLLEGGAYGLLAIAAPLGVAFAARLRGATQTGRPFTHDLASTMRSAAFVGLAIAACVLLVARNPWWGGHDAFNTQSADTGLATLCLAAAAGLSLLLGRALSRGEAADSARFAAAGAATVFALCFGHAAIRWLHQQGAMDDTPQRLVGLEGFAHALWPLAFVLAGAELTARAPGRDTIRAYLHDLRAIWSFALWPALIWSALTLWLWFNPWWGAAPAIAATPAAALMGLTTLLLAALLSALAPNVSGAAFKPALSHAAQIASVGHLFVALSLTIRWLFHRSEMAALYPGTSLETWTYSAAWAVFGAVVLGAGMARQRQPLTWIGLGVLAFVILKVFVFDLSALSGVARAASFLALGGVLAAAALAARRLRPAEGSRE